MRSGCLTKHIPFDPQPLLDVHDLKHGRRKAEVFPRDDF